ncbi:MAG: hypothetical protein EOO36_22080, partial [Cytophagaceae bacterium]
MLLRFRYSDVLKPLGAAALLGAGALLEGCRHESVVPTPAVDYYPLEVGTYRTYAVSDTVWNKGVATPATYQFREAVTEQFTDAAGQPAYRVLRARRATSTSAWSDDSVLVVQQQAQAILLTRDNVRTIELIYPLRAGRVGKLLGHGLPKLVGGGRRHALVPHRIAHGVGAVGAHLQGVII